MNIAIVFGGKSIEHDVSIVTAKQIYEVSKNKYNCVLLYLDKNNNWFVYQNKNFEFKDFRENKFLEPAKLFDGSVVVSKFLKNIKFKVDCAIVCCHGGVGENGSLESMLMLAGIPVSCGSPTALGIAMDKWKTKLCLRGIGINTINGEIVKQSMSKDEILQKIKNINYPIIIKPCTGGSSIGISVAHNDKELFESLEVGFKFDKSCVIECALTDFEEYNQAVFGDGDNFELSYIERPKKHEEILSFEDKYLSGEKKAKGMKGQATDKKIDLNKKYIEQMKSYSTQIFKDFGFFGVIRIDYIFDKTNQKLYVNEINAVPGSLAIYFFSTNKPALQFVDRIIEIGIENYKKLNNFNVNYITKLF